MWPKISRWIHRHEALLFILCLVALLRLPSLLEPYWYGDESIYLTIGQDLRRGALLYKDIFDHKPPVIYWLSALVNGNLFWFKFLTLGVNLLTVVGFHKLVKKLAVAQAGWITLVFGLITTLPWLEGNIANAELLFLLPVVWAFYFGLKPKNVFNIFTAGLLFGVATLVKIPAAFEMVALGGFWLLTSPKSLIKSIAILGLGFSLPVILSWGYFALQGLQGEYIKYAWTYNLSYSANWKTVHIFDTLVAKVAVVAIIWLGAFFARKRLSPLALLVLTWLPLSLLAALLSNRPYPHYLLQLATSGSLVLGLVWIGAKKDKLVAAGLAVLVLLTVVNYKFQFYPTLTYYHNFLSWVGGQKSLADYSQWFNGGVNRNYAVAKIIMAASKPTDQVFVWGDEPMIYALAKRSPATKYTVRFHILSLKAETEVFQVLHKDPPRFIVTFDKDESLMGLSTLLTRDYILEKQIQNAQVYRRIKI